jgi:ppGpp synthetase/RelA/SpoT-type nucleotidyltranferase
VTHELFSAAARQTAADFARRAATALDRDLQSAAGAIIVEGHGVAWRVKSETAIRAKLARSQAINDFIGIRLLATHAGMIDPILGNLSAWEAALGLKRLRIADGFARLDESGFRSTHIDYEPADNRISGLVAGMTLELQLTTWLQHLHGFLSHQLYYKAPERDAAVSARLRTLSDRLIALDSEVALLMSGMKQR